MTRPHRIHTAQEVLANAEAMGWEVRRAKAKHYVVFNPDGRSTTIVDNANQHGNGVRNQDTQLKRTGYYEAYAAWEAQKAEERRERMKKATALATLMEPPARVPEDAYTELIQVTPDLAAKWLELPPAKLGDGTSIIQRTVAQHWVDEIAGWIERGEWVTTPEGLIFANTGALLDGQHRLWAVVQTGATVPMRAWFNIDPEVFAVLNQGRRRTNAHVLQTAGETNTFILSSAAKLLHCYLGRIEGVPELSTWKTWSSWHQTPQQMRTLLGPSIEGNPFSGHGALRDSVGPGGAMVGGAVHGVRAAGVVAHYLITSTWDDQDAVNSYVEGLRTGLDLTKGAPAHTVREWLIRNKPVRGSSKRDQQLLVILRGWRSHVKGRTLTYLKKLDEDDFEPMPKPHESR